MNKNKTLLVPSIIRKYVKMKSLFGNDVNNSELRKNIIYIINNVIINNVNIKFNDLVKQYGIKYTNGSVVVLFGAYIDGYLDSKKDIVNRLYDEREIYLNNN
jgi:ABC-type uncharacterized transport system substrate-binding protein